MESEAQRLHPISVPLAVAVKTNREGDPIRIRDPRTGKFQRVETIQEVWQVDDEWWRKPLSRLYYRVILENGRLMVLFRDLIEDRWHSQ